MTAYVCGVLCPDTMDDVQHAVVSALRAAERDVCSVKYGEPWPEGRTAIVLGAHDFALNRPHPRAVPPPAGCILYDLEQPAPEYITAITKAARMFAAKTVWCFSKAMTAAVKGQGVTAIHVPFGCVPEMRRLKKAEEDIDVFFYGHLTPRRQRVLDACRGAGLNVMASGDCWGAERDRFLEQSKIVLNTHKYDGHEFEAVRVAFLIANGKCVVSERGAGHERFKGAIAFADLDGVSTLCKFLIRDPSARFYYEDKALVAAQKLCFKLPIEAIEEEGKIMHDSVLAWVSKTSAALKIRNASPVLEVGSYNVNGSVRQFFLDNKIDYLGVDVVAGPGVDEVVSPIALPSAADAFAVVVSTEMLEHAAFPALVLAEMRRVLKPGGILLLTTRSEGFLYHNPPDYFRYSVDQMRDLLKWLGFTRISVEVDSDPRHQGVFAIAYKPESADWVPPQYNASSRNQSESLSVEFAEKVHAYLDVEMPDDWWNLAVLKKEMIRDTNDNFAENARRRIEEELTSAEGGFGYCFRRAAPHVDTCYCVVCDALKLFNSEAMFRRVKDETGIDVKSLGLHFASCYGPGDFLAAHTDKGNGQVAFVWNLTKNWRPQYGGLLHLMSSDWSAVESTINNVFNTLTLFDVREGRPHFVSQVIAGVKEKRLAISGWFL